MSPLVVFGSIGLAVAALFLCFRNWRRGTNVPEALSTSLTGALLGGLAPGLLMQLELDDAVSGLSCITSALGAVSLTAFTLSRPRQGAHGLIDSPFPERQHHDQ